MSGGFVAAAAIVGAAGSYLSAREQNKVAKEAAKPKETVSYRLPYMNEYISRVSPYILSEAQKMYENRLKQYGMKPGDFSPIAQMLSGISTDYSGVGKPGSPQMLSGGNGVTQNSGMQNIFAGYQPPSGSQMPSASTLPLGASQEARDRMRARREEMMNGGDMGGGGGMQDLIAYWR